MPKYRVTAPDGTNFEVNAPEGATEADALEFAKAEFAKKAPMTIAPAVTPRQQLQASGLMRGVQGMRDPIDAAAQLLPRGLEAITGLGGFAPNKVSEFFGSEAKRVDAMNAAAEKEYEASRAATGSTGFDAARLAGNVLSPANAAIAARLPAAATTMGRVGSGAAVGAIGGGLTPVTMDDPAKSFAAQKLMQTGMGAAAGGIMTPLLGKVGDAASKWLASRPSKTGVSYEDVERIARSVTAESGQRWENLEPAAQQAMRQQATESLAASGAKLDRAALLRKQDFTREGMAPTLGQITRDASQYASERNLRTMPGVGDPLLQRFEQQGKQLQSKVGEFAAGAQEPYQAGGLLMNALKAKDEQLRQGVSSAYAAARASAGKDAEVPMQGIAQTYADVLDSFGDKVPSGVKNQFGKFGLDPSVVSNQRKLFTVEEADKLIKNINQNQSSDPATNTALGLLRNAVKDSVTKDAGVEDVFTPARKAAAERFKMHEAVPALEAAAAGTVAPDDFVRKFVLNGKTNEVSGLAKALQSTNPEAFQAARAQIGADLQKAAFGQNVAGDKPFAQERFAAKLSNYGTEKLKAFFTETEIEQMRRLSRIGAYINSMPNASPVQTSNNWGAIMSVAGKIPGVSPAAGLLGAAKEAATRQSLVRNALQAKVPTQLEPEDIRLLGGLLSGAGASGGLFAGQQFK